MKLSCNWLKDYLVADLTPEQIAEAMTSIGIEVDSLETAEQIPGGLAGVVVAHVLTCVEHPDSDHLHITTVDDGSPEPVTVVCGAPNVAAGQKVLFARIGTVLPGDFKIKKSKIRNVIRRVVPDGPHEVLLVLDASTGQNAFIQAREFSKATDVTALAVTKLDGSAKGGVVVGIVDQFKFPIKFLGIGEGVEDLKVFDKKEFVEDLFKLEDIQ